MKNEVLTDNQLDGWWDVARVGSWLGSRAGSPEKIEISWEDIEQMADSYDPAVLESPVTLEHSRKGPAHGWVSDVRVIGDRLQVRFRDMSEALKKLLKEGAYRSRSIEMYNPFKPTGGAYLAAVTFLGAAAPAVKGLEPEPINLGESGRAVRLFVGGDNQSRPIIGKGEKMQQEDLRLRFASSLKGLFGQAEEQKMDEGELPEDDFENEDDDVVKARLLERIEELEVSLDEKLRTCRELEQRLADLKKALEEEEALRREAEEKIGQLEGEVEEKEEAFELAEYTAELAAAEKDCRLTPVESTNLLKLGTRLDTVGRKAILEEVCRRRPLALFSEISAPAVNEPNIRTNRIEREKSRFKGFPADPEHDKALELMSREEGLTFSEALKEVREESNNYSNKR